MDEQLKVVIGAETGQATTAVNKFNQALGGVKPGANQAALALNNLGRVAQDVPFGFIGIANNLNPLLESFQRLRAEAGSNAGALKLLGSSLMGAGGIGLALSAVTAILSFASMGFASWTGSTKKAKEEADEFSKSIKEIGDLQNEAVAGVQGQIATVNALAKVITDSNKPYADRKRALEELKETNKSYFGDLTLESAQLSILSAKVKEYTQALIQQAVVKKFSDAIADTAEALGKQEKAVNKARTALAQANKELEKQQEIGEKQAPQRAALFAGENVNNAFKINEALTKVVENEKRLREENEKLTDLGVQRIDQTNELNKAVSEGLKLRDIDPARGRTAKIKDTLGDELKALFRTSNIIDPTSEQTTLHRMLNGILDDWDSFTEKLRAPKEGKLPIKEFILDPVAAAQEQLKVRLKEMGESVSAVLNQLRNDLVFTLGASIGEALAGGNVKALFGNFLSVLADAAIQLGKIAIATGLAMKAIRVSFNSLNPAIAIAAGIALVALGTLTKASISKIPKFAEGGIVTRPTIGLFGEAGPEAIIPLHKMDSVGNREIEIYGEFRQRGSDLIAVVNKATRSHGRIT